MQFTTANTANTATRRYRIGLHASQELASALFFRRVAVLAVVQTDFFQ